MKIEIKWKNRKYYFGIKYSHDRRICWIYGYDRCHWERPVNPYNGWKHQIVWGYQLHKLKKNNELYKQCQGCGGGISKYRIRDPNHGYGNKRFNCCEGCVDFYDRRWSAMDIVGWEDKEPVCKKGSRCIEIKKEERK